RRWDRPLSPRSPRSQTLFGNAGSRNSVSRLRGARNGVSRRCVPKQSLGTRKEYQHKAAALIDLGQSLGQPHALVVGDRMIDRYVWGDAERISQEAPVILLRADKREERLGGASSVATMLRALGAKVALAGVVGPDADGARIRQILSDLGIDYEGVVTD